MGGMWAPGCGEQIPAEQRLRRLIEKNAAIRIADSGAGFGELFFDSRPRISSERGLRFSRLRQLRQTKIQNLCVAALGDKDVSWFDVPMNYPEPGCGTTERGGRD